MVLLLPLLLLPTPPPTNSSSSFSSSSFSYLPSCDLNVLARHAPPSPVIHAHPPSATTSTTTNFSTAFPICSHRPHCISIPPQLVSSPPFPTPAPLLLLPYTPPHHLYVV
ncbi:hypothetical protein E2C01_042503 [Portunus trituberculatus]|uniref:Uncharacterized protein n=1 Tax=Portunus trituberculatus TaxID=210409 RepID=A0A5B7FM02_PORTR|nr:hypothetical protein [Portunus trituberculatus]